MSMTATVLPTSDESASRSRRDAMVQVMLHADELAWMVDEKYLNEGPTWQFNLIRQGEQSRWMLQRYRYDIPSGTLNFTGEYSIDDEAFALVRQHGVKIDTRHL
ncbi:hypothetical protein HC891_12475 [Candidatus Gracilibacteria bacterium]|nr:hypothetical protein [Candidatus Gracilibacteria bacterium]